jgi:hypothetical protein
MVWRRGALVLTALFVVGTSAACSNLSQRCNAIGGEPGVMVVIQRPWPSQTVTAQVCIADTCRSAVSNGTQGSVFREGYLWVAHPALTSERRVSATISLTGDAGKVLVAPVVRTLAPTKAQPNGPGCEPTFFVGTATVTPRP